MDGMINDPQKLNERFLHNSWDNLTKQDEEDAALGEDCNQDCDFEIVISKS